MPARAASIEKGSPVLDWPAEKGGGLIRVNGLAFIRRRDKMPFFLLFVGERPAGAGADDGVTRLCLSSILVVLEMAWARSMYCEGWAGARAKRGVFSDFVKSKSKVLDFLEGEEKVKGSMFSVSMSSNSSGA